MEFVGQELAEPLGPEFARFYDEQRLGMDGRMALLSFQERVGTLDIRMFVTSLLIQRETGGNLSEVLTNTATLMRERVSVRGQLETLTAEAKYSGRILALLPVLVFLRALLRRPRLHQDVRRLGAGSDDAVRRRRLGGRRIPGDDEHRERGLLRGAVPLPAAAADPARSGGPLGGRRHLCRRRRARSGATWWAGRRAAADIPAGAACSSTSPTPIGSRCASDWSRSCPRSGRATRTRRISWCRRDSTAPSWPGLYTLFRVATVVTLAAARPAGGAAEQCAAVHDLRRHLGGDRLHRPDLLPRPRRAPAAGATPRTRFPTRWISWCSASRRDCGFNAALLRVARDMQLVHPELAREFIIINRKVNAGMVREEALRTMWNRTGVDEIRVLVQHLIQSRPVGHERRQGPARVRRDAAEEAAPGGGEEGGHRAAQDDVSARHPDPAGAVHRHPRARCRAHHPILRQQVAPCAPPDATTDNSGATPRRGTTLVLVAFADGRAARLRGLRRRLEPNARRAQPDGGGRRRGIVGGRHAARSGAHDSADNRATQFAGLNPVRGQSRRSTRWRHRNTAPTRSARYACNPACDRSFTHRATAIRVAVRASGAPIFAGFLGSFGFAMSDRPVPYLTPRVGTTNCLHPWAIPYTALTAVLGGGSPRAISPTTICASSRRGACSCARCR